MDIILLLLWLVYFLVVDDNLGYFSYIGPFLMLVDSVVRSFFISISTPASYFEVELRVCLVGQAGSLSMSWIIKQRSTSYCDFQLSLNEGNCCVNNFTTISLRNKILQGTFFVTFHNCVGVRDVLLITMVSSLLGNCWVTEEDIGLLSVIYNSH